MDGRHFDEFAKALANGGSRRRMLKTVGASALASLRGSRLGARARQTTKETLGVAIDYFALGDSVASGHGLMDDGTACHRSGLAYPYKVLDALAARFAITSVRHLACSGATAATPQDPEDDNHWFRSQVGKVIEHLEDRALNAEGDDGPEPLALISITIGANDFRWLHPSILVHFVEFAAGFENWVGETAAVVAQELRTALTDLLAFPQVRVVITEYPNPVNRDSIIFRLVPRGLTQTCGDALGTLTCYERSEIAIHNLNSSFGLDVHARLSAADQQRVRVVPVHAAFHRSGGREAPGPIGQQDTFSGLCGFAPPGTAETWIQYPGDPSSNSELGIAGATLARTGDCFHPRERGAEEIARLVAGAAFDLLSIPNPDSPLVLTNPTVTHTAGSTQPSAGNGCSSGSARCGRACVDLRTSGLHCGSCDNRCGVFQTCCDGVCGCPRSAAMFPGACAPGEPIC